eukprot:m.25100 g.25100  ORF g.25100 m.25100 type:complete len:487 (+) comp14877_c0_seq1:210-1670(+)
MPQGRAAVILQTCNGLCSRIRTRRPHRWHHHYHHRHHGGMTSTPPLAIRAADDAFNIVSGNRPRKQQRNHTHTGSTFFPCRVNSHTDTHPNNLNWMSTHAASRDEDQIWRPTEKISKQILKMMDKDLIGHRDLKQAIIMALLCREHVYAEGPPGVGKTMLAEISAAATSLDFYFYQMHRDTRLQEIIGDAVIFREKDAAGGEIIRQENRPGGIITAQLCVLDDISRAPGEALNILLRILNERKFGSETIPLLSAIATANPATDEYYTEALDPANLDRFTFQIQSTGLIQQHNWEDAARVIDLFADLNTHVARDSELVPFVELEQAFSSIQKIPITDEAKRGLLLFLHVLGSQHNLDASNSLLSDRTFLVKALKVMRTYAFTLGQETCDASALRSLRFLTTFRMPQNVHALVPTIVEDIISNKISFEKMLKEQQHEQQPNATTNPLPKPSRQSASELFSLDKVPTGGVPSMTSRIPTRDEVLKAFTP